MLRPCLPFEQHSSQILIPIMIFFRYRYTSATLSQQDFTESKKTWGHRECYNAVNNGGVIGSHEM